MTLRKLNTNVPFQVRRNKAFSPNIYVTYKQNDESHSHLFLHRLVAWGLWNSIFGVLGEEWVCPTSVDDLLLIRIFEGRKEEIKMLTCI